MLRKKNTHYTGNFNSGKVQIVRFQYLNITATPALSISVSLSLTFYLSAFISYSKRILWIKDYYEIFHDIEKAFFSLESLKNKNHSYIIWPGLVTW